MNATTGAGAPTWVVVDAETTGLSPREHRIIELAVIVLDERGNPLGEAGTLVNPEGDVGPVDGHGIRPEDVANAPRFADLAGWLASWLQYKVLVGHNLLFTTAFLDEEYRRAGYVMPHVPAICTMTNAPRYLPSLPGRTLEQCCAAAGVPITGPRSALTNVRAAAALFGRFLAQRPVLPSPWITYIERAQRTPWPEIPMRNFRMTVRPEPPAETWAEPAAAAGPESTASASASAESAAPNPEVSSEFVAEVVDNAPRAVEETEPVSAYLGALDDAVSDRVLSFTEAIHLKDLAGALAIFEAEQAEAHRSYLRTLAATAWTDHQVTEAERADLVAVGRLLDVSEEEVAELIEEARPDASERAAEESGTATTGTPAGTAPAAAAGTARVVAARSQGASSTGGNAGNTGEVGNTTEAAKDGDAGESGGYEAGWYPDPYGEHALRWFDGESWTHHTHD